MSLKVLGDAVTRFHKIVESEPYRDLGWADELTGKMDAQRLVIAGRPVTPVLRPHFVTKRQYEHLVKASEALTGAIDRVKKLALGNPQLLNRIALLPAEKMLAQIDPGYSFLSVTSALDTHLQNGHLQFAHYNAELPQGIAYSELLSDVFYDAAPVKEFRKKYSLAKIGGSKHLLGALLKAYKEFGGKKHPNIAILEFKQPFANFESGEYQLLAELFRRQGHATEIVSPDQLEYRNGVLRKGDFEVHLVFRRMKISEFLLRFDLNHPLVRAYREGNVCVVNNFRSEVAQKKAIFDLLTDPEVTAKFPAAERHAIAEYIPWTRVVANVKTKHGSRTIDLPDHILKQRTKLVLRPNDQSAELPTVVGKSVDDAQWERAVKRALVTPYVVQEHIEPVVAPFPVRNYAGLTFRDMAIEVHPHSFLGKTHGCSTWLTSLGAGYTGSGGLAPTFILEPK